jgi:hypothetical protein
METIHLISDGDKAIFSQYHRFFYNSRDEEQVRLVKEYIEQINRMGWPQNFVDPLPVHGMEVAPYLSFYRDPRTYGISYRVNGYQTWDNTDVDTMMINQFNGQTPIQADEGSVTPLVDVPQTDPED